MIPTIDYTFHWPTIASKKRTVRIYIYISVVIFFADLVAIYTIIVFVVLWLGSSLTVGDKLIDC